MDCELKLNSFDNISPMAIFFETAFKLIYAERYQALSPQAVDHMKFSALLQDAGLQEYLRETYHFVDDGATIDSIIRRQSNRKKHSVNAAEASPEEVKRCFRLLFDFSACYYAVKTGKPQPHWDEAAYQAVLDSAVDVEARSKRVLAYESQITQLQEDLAQSRAKDIAYAKEIEALKSQLEVQIFKNADRVQLAQQQARMEALKAQLDDSQSQRIYLSAALERAESGKKQVGLELARVQLQAERAGAEQAEAFRQKQALLTEKLRLADQSIEALNQQNSSLQAEIAAVSVEKEAAQKELYELGRQSANLDKLSALEGQLAKIQQERTQLQQQLHATQQRLEEAEGHLFVANDEISRINQAYLETRKNLARLDLPKCPRCNSPLQVKTRKDKTGQFWSCSSWKPDGSGCKFTRNILPVEQTLVQQLLTLEGKQLRLSPKTLKKHQVKFVPFAAYPDSFGSANPTAFLFQSIAVPMELFPNRDALNLRFFSQFQMCCNREKVEVAAPERTLYSLALRLLNRGIVVPASEQTDAILREKFQQKSTGTVNALFNYIRYSHPQNPYGSDLEQEFAEYYFPKLLGESWATYVTAQAGFDVLVPGEENPFLQQRVDFLLEKNGRRIVVELDGPEHSGSQENDQARDSFLTGYGIQVLRFPNDAVKEHSLELLEALRHALGKDRTAVKDTELDDRYLVSCKLAHQLEITIVKALEQGYLSRQCSLRAYASTGLFSDSELQFILTAAVTEVQRILEHYAALYGLDLSWDLLDTDSGAVKLAVGEGGGYLDPDNITLRDCYLSGNYQCDIAPFDSGILPKHCGLETLEFFLRYLFGYPQFRDGQYAALCRLLRREDSIILLPTGAGKSMIYQISSFLVPGMIVVVSPLKSLIEDQVSNLEWKYGINNAVPLMSAVTDQDRDARDRAVIRMQHNATSLLYLSPERLAIPSFRQVLPRMMVQNSVYAVAIDEAHCVSEWGHDFRPAYLNIGRTARSLFQKGGVLPTLIALTGTASDAVLKDVQRELGIFQPGSLIVPDTFDRPELHFRVYQCPSTDKSLCIAGLVKKELPQAFHLSFEDFIRLDGGNTHAGIVFTPLTSRSTLGQYDATSLQIQLSGMLPEAGIASYFSTTPKGYTEESWKVTIGENARRFKKNELNLLVATKAFGMGIDKENIRYIIHNGIPSSFEQYYQEAGRAGRDRKASECILLLSISHDGQNDELLSPTLDLQEFTDKFHTYKPPNAPACERDDLNAILYFHTTSYQGIEAECAFTDTIIDRLEGQAFQTGRKVSLYLKAGSARERQRLSTAWRHALVRLSVLGVISDYTDDYRGNFTLTLGSIKREDVMTHYINYISWNSQGRAERERSKLDGVKEDGLVFVKAAVRALVEYIYDSIEQSRRRAIREMYMTAKEAAALPPEEQDGFFRQRILHYFSYQDVRRDDLQEMLTEANAGLHILPRLFPPEAGRERFDQEERQRAAGLNVAAGRMLESNPDHPGLLLAQASAEIIAGDYSESVIANDVAAAVRYASERYSVSQDALELALHQTLDLALTSSVKLFETVLDRVIEPSEKTNWVEKLLLSGQISDANRTYLLYSYALNRANHFLTGESKHDKTGRTGAEGKV